MLVLNISNHKSATPASTCFKPSVSWIVGSLNVFQMTFMLMFLLFKHYSTFIERDSTCATSHSHQFNLVLWYQICTVIEWQDVRLLLFHSYWLTCCMYVKHLAGVHIFNSWYEWKLIVCKIVALWVFTDWSEIKKFYSTLSKTSVSVFHSLLNRFCVMLQVLKTQCCRNFDVKIFT